MANLEDAILYILKNYPYKSELSNARVTKMLYLADWHSVINGHEPVTSITWYYDNYGPYVTDVKETATNSSDITVAHSETAFGNKKDIFSADDSDRIPRISDIEKLSLDHVITSTKHLSWSAFIKLVYSTYPVASSSKYTFFDLKKLALLYRAT